MPVIYAPAMRRCTKMSCVDPAVAIAGLRYRERVLWLRDLPAERDPNFLELCEAHAERMTAPVGWNRLDERASTLERMAAQESPAIDAALLEAAVSGRLV
jgi:hypothetical protein